MSLVVIVNLSQIKSKLFHQIILFLLKTDQQKQNKYIFRLCSMVEEYNWSKIAFLDL